MGLMDRDYMHEKRSDKSFRPPPEKSITGWFLTVLIFIAVMYAGFKGAHWLDDRARVKLKPVNAAPSPAPELPAQAPPILPNLPRAQSEATAPQSRAESIVTKCVSQGKVSYTDGTCPAGATTSKVVTRADENRIAAVTVPVAVQSPVVEPPPMMAQVSAGPSYTQLKAECAALDERIKYLDSLARKPQPGQMQDWISGQRKDARDRQFRMRCQ